MSGGQRQFVEQLRADLGVLHQLGDGRVLAQGQDVGDVYEGGERPAFGGEVPGVMVIAGDVGQVVRELPEFAEPGAEVLVRGADLLHLDGPERRLGMAACRGDRLDELRLAGLDLDDDADVMKQAGEEGFVEQPALALLGEELGGDRDGDRVGPEVVDIEMGADLPAVDQLGETGGDRDVLDGLHAQQDDGAIDRADLSGHAVERAVNDFQDPRGEGGIVGDDIAQVARGRVAVLDELDNAQGNLGQGDEVADLMDRRSDGVAHLLNIGGGDDTFRVYFFRHKVSIGS